MSTPKIIFKINKTLDLRTGLLFRDIKAGGIDFRKWGLLAPHPNLRIHRHLTQSILATHIDHYYRRHGKELEKARLNFARTWKNTSRIFLSLTKTIFGTGFPPPTTYTCYLSIWNCNPRDIRHRSFQIFYKHKNPLETVMHEMLHFAFYAYMYEHFPHLKHSEYTKALWEFSEAFNTVILNSPKWRKKLHTKLQPPYPKLRSLVRIMRKQWMQNQSIKHFLQTVLTIKMGSFCLLPSR